LLIAGCSGAGSGLSHGEDLSREGEPIVSTTSAFVIQGAPNFAPGSGTFPEIPLNGAPSRQGTFTDYADFTMAFPAYSAQSAWTSQFPSNENMLSPMLLGTNGYIPQALARAGTDTNFVGATNDIAKVLDAWQSTVGGKITGPTTFSSKPFAGYPAVRGQWLREVKSPLTDYTYADPVALQEQRERGARLYCAARQAQFQQPATGVTMGSQPAFSINVLGQKVDFLVVEPTAVLAGPERFVGSSSDGAQAFEVPMEFGTRITPIRGLFGLDASLGEMRYPVALISGDSEVVNHDRFPGAPNSFDDTVTTTHVDAVESNGAYGDVATGPFTLLSWGPFAVKLSFDLKVTAGDTTAPPPFAFNDQRVLDTDGFIGGPFPAMRTGTLGMNTSGKVGYHDGAWNYDPPGAYAYVLPDGSTNPYWRVQITPWAPTYTRLFQDDDHLLGRANSMTLTATLTGEAGIDFGPLNATFDVSGSIEGNAAQAHMIQDALMAEKVPGDASMRPATSLTVRPRLLASAGFYAGATLHFKLDLGIFGTLSWDANLLNIGTAQNPINIASYDSGPWQESSALRIGTWSGVGQDPMNMPSVKSHLPESADYESFQEPVPSCLADTRPNPATPPACQPKKSTGPAAAPSTNLCAYIVGRSATGAPPPICQNIGMYAASMWPFSAADAAAILAFLCSPTSHQAAGYSGYYRQSNADTVSHIVDSNGLTALALRLRQAGVDASKAGVAQATIESSLQSLIGFGACDNNAVLLGPGQMFSWTDIPTEAPPVSPGGPCQ
jgi:hypothetical protein